MYLLLVSVVFTLSTYSRALAEDVETNAITAWCVLSTDEAYAHAICNRLKQEAEKLSGIAKLKHTSVKTQPDVPGVPNMGNQKPAEGTLNLLFFIRGTEGANPGVSVRIVAGVDVPADDVGVAVSTRVRIVLWEQSAVAGGPVDHITKAMGDHMAGKLSNFYDWLVTEIEKQE